MGWIVDWNVASAQAVIAIVTWVGDLLDLLIRTVLDAVDAIGYWRYVVAFVGTFAETSLFLGLIIPGDSIVLATSAGNRGWAEWVFMLFVIVAGSVGGQSVGYAIGHWFGPKLRRSRAGRRIGEKNWVRSEQWLERRGGWAIFISRFLPVLHSLTPVTVGMTHYPYRHFIRWTVPACIAWALLYVSIGTVAGAAYEQYSDQLKWAGWVVLGGLIGVLGAIALLRRALERYAQRSLR